MNTSLSYFILCSIGLSEKTGPYAHSDLRSGKYVQALPFKGNPRLTRIVTHGKFHRTSNTLHGISYSGAKLEIKSVKSYRTLSLTRALRESKIPYEYKNGNSVSIELFGHAHKEWSRLNISGNATSYTVAISHRDYTTSLLSTEVKHYPMGNGFSLLATMITDGTIYSLRQSFSPDDPYATYAKRSSAKQFKNFNLN